MCVLVEYRFVSNIRFVFKISRVFTAHPCQKWHFSCHAINCQVHHSTHCAVHWTPLQLLIYIAFHFFFLQYGRGDLYLYCNLLSYTRTFEVRCMSAAYLGIFILRSNYADLFASDNSVSVKKKQHLSHCLNLAAAWLEHFSFLVLPLTKDGAFTITFAIIILNSLILPIQGLWVDRKTCNLTMASLPCRLLSPCCSVANWSGLQKA